MRIGIDIRALQEGKTTGVQVYIKNLLQALFQLDSQNKYLLFANSAKDLSARLPKFDYPNVELKYFRFSNKLLTLRQKLFSHPKIDQLLGGVDLFFSPHWREISLSKNVPLIITFHDLSFEAYPEFFTKRQIWWHRLMRYRHAAREATHLISVSESTKRDLVSQYGVNPEKISVIYPGVPAAIQQQNCLDQTFPQDYFLFFATFEPRKNLQAVIAAYKDYLLTSAIKRDLVIAGSTGWKAQELIIPKELLNRVQIYSQVSESEKTYLYQHAFATIFLSLYEGFGFPVLEAASFGKPVIASFTSSLSEIADNFALLVNPIRPVQAAAAMLGLEKDSGLYHKLEQAGKEAVGKFSWDIAAKELIKLFEQVRK